MDKEMQGASLKETMRIAWAIFRKDVVDAIRNKTILTSIGSVVFVVLAYRFLPGLDEEEVPVRLALYDGGHSALALALEESPNLRVWVYDSATEMQAALVEADNLGLGLVLPAGVDQWVDDGEALALDGYIAYWIADREARPLVELVEDEIAYWTDGPVQIDLDGHKVYPLDPDRPGSGFLVSVVLVFALVMMGAMIVTHLILDEKQARTIDALLVSPASPGQLLLGKGLVGLAYASIAVVAVLALNAAYIVHWGVAALAAFCGALFAVGLGILLGVLFDSRQQLIIWGFLLMGTLMLPPFLIIGADGLPAAVATAFRSLPTTATAWIVRASFVPDVPLWGVLRHASLVLASAAAVFALAVWRVRRLER
jgi:ABC-2 type transport system permease protein